MAGGALVDWYSKASYISMVIFNSIGNYDKIVVITITQYLKPITFKRRYAAVVSYWVLIRALK